MITNMWPITKRVVVHKERRQKRRKKCPVCLAPQIVTAQGTFIKHKFAKSGLGCGGSGKCIHCGK